MSPTAQPDLASRQELFGQLDRYLPLVQHVLYQVSAGFPRHADREELAQAATLGLVEAAHRFDPAHGVPFERWAVRRIRGSIIDSLRALDFAPRRVRAAGRELEQVTNSLTTRLGRPPSAAETAVEMGISVRELSRLKAKVHRALVLSLDATLDGIDADDSNYTPALVDADATPVEALERRELDAYVRDAVTLLPERLQRVVIAYFLEGSSSADIATELGVTESRVSQLRAEAVSLMRAGIEGQYQELRDATELPDQPVAAPRGAEQRRAAYAASLAAASTFADRINASGNKL